MIGCDFCDGQVLSEVFLIWQHLMGHERSRLFANDYTCKFPAHRGGPMWYADSVGLEKVYERVRDFEQAHGENWRPAPLLKQLAEQGKSFADFQRSSNPH
jgi:hypothetical protein